MERWVQNYSELYSRENVVTKEALNNIECLPVLEELESEPTLAETKRKLLAHVMLKRLQVRDSVWIDFRQSLSRITVWISS